MIQFYLNNTTNLPPFNSTHYIVLYPQNDNHIVTIDSVMSLHPIILLDENLKRLTSGPTDRRLWSCRRTSRVSVLTGCCLIHRMVVSCRLCHGTHLSIHSFLIICTQHQHTAVAAIQFSDTELRKTRGWRQQAGRKMPPSKHRHMCAHMYTCTDRRTTLKYNASGPIYWIGKGIITSGPIYWTGKGIITKSFQSHMDL